MIRQINKIQKGKYDGVLILGRNWKGYPWRKTPITQKVGNYMGNDGRQRENDLPISDGSRINCLAAGNFHLRGLTKKIVVGTGRSAEDWPSEAEEMRNYILRRFRGKISPEDILEQEHTLETYSELEENIKIAEGNGLTNLALITVRTQLPRCKRHLEKLGKDIDCFNSENIVEQMEQNRQKGKNPYPLLVKRYRNSPGVTYYERTKELILRGFQFCGITKSLTKRLANIARRQR